MKFIVLLILLPFCYGNNPCPKGKYQSTFSRLCWKCTQCKPHEIVIRTCQSHRNTICSLKSSGNLFNHNSLENDNNNQKKKKNHHFEEGKLHYFSVKNKEEISDLNYPALELAIKHDNMHKYFNSNDNKKYNDVKKKQRINDKFLKWDEDDDDDDDDYDDDEDEDDSYVADDLDDVPQKHREHKLLKSKHHNHKEHHLHFTNLLDSEEEDSNNDSKSDEDDNLATILDKHAKSKWNTKKWKDDKVHKNENHKKNTARLAQLEDEKKLEEWLVQSKKQFKDRKDNLLKTLKEEQQISSYESDKRIRLNYPLSNTNDRFSDSFKYNTKNNEKSKTQRKHSESEMELFKELIKNEESQEMELATLMSNKKDQPFHYKTVVTPSHRMFLGAPSVEANIGGHVKDPQEVIKEEMGRNIIYEKSKFSVVPIIKHDNLEEMVPVTFTAAERLVWDWQAVAVVSAIAACLLFFLVIAIFVLFNARLWRKEKYSFNADSEEMSSRIALIHPNLEASAAEGNNTNRLGQQF